MSHAVITSEIELSMPDFHRFRKLIYEKAGISLCDSKHTLVQSRLARRLRELELGDYNDYYKVLTDPRRSAEETEYFVNCLTTNKTEFFRESHHFDFLRDRLFPEIQQRALKGGPKRVRIWSAACSTGQEPYTLALTAREFFPANSEWDIRILASDIDTDVLQKASEGVYPAELLDDVPERFRKKYFARLTRDPDGPVQVREDLRNLIAFRQINFIDSEWPINTQFDAIFCRNVMIYFDQDTRRNLVRRFMTFMKPESYLFIGHSESLLGLSDQFDTKGNTIYQMNAAAAAAQPYKETVRSEPTVQRRSPNPVESVRPKRTRRTEPMEQTLQGSVQGSCQGRTAVQSKPLPPSQSARDEGGTLPATAIIVGEFHAQDKPGIVSTVLGSCVAACLYDEVLGIGGMNHFMLPESRSRDQNCASYGVHAMEMLINSIMKLGGDRRRLKAKFFGGAKLFAGAMGTMDIGASNVAFIRRFLDTEGIPTVASHTGGDCGMRVRFMTHTGQAFVSPLEPSVSQEVERSASARASQVWSSAAKVAEPCLF